MTLAAGTRLGPYEIVSAIGAGGMGEVFRAHDTRLGRDVAIKVLPEAFASDHERLARFRREAHILASLNHPSIAAIYGIEEVGAPLAGARGEAGERAGTRPAPKGPTIALVMELVTGEDLAERLRRGAIPVDEAIAIAKQIAEALEEAHEHGIVHRDLKPGNVKVTPEGKVKVLDFGLAKALEAETTDAPNSQLSHSPTMSRRATEAGIILGTAAYMSPEQARGKPVDKRADIWSFGVVLFEMLTGRRLFEGETVSDTLAAVLREEVPWASLPAQTPRGVVQLLRRCLTRDPRQRLRDIGDARFALVAAETPEATEPSDDRANSIPATSPRTPAWQQALPWGLLAAVCVALIAALLAWAPWRPAPLLPETRVDIVTPATDRPTDFALSPDGWSAT